MKTVGDKLESFNVTGVKPGFNQHEENGAVGLRADHREVVRGQVEDHLFLPEGLHVRLPDRDHRLRQAREASSPTATPWCSAARPTTSSSSSAGAATTRTSTSLEPLAVRRHHRLARRPARRARHEGGRGAARDVHRRPGQLDPARTVNNLNVGRSPEETLRILDGLQTDELCPCNRTVGGDVLKAPESKEAEPKPVLHTRFGGCFHWRLRKWNSWTI